MENLKILGIIPARGGSKEVPRKNLEMIGEQTLVQRALLSAEKSKFLSRFIVSTDDKEIFEHCEELGFKPPFLRPSEIAQDHSSSFDVIRHAYDWFRDEESWVADVLVILQPTTPFREANHIDGTLKLLRSDKVDAAISITEPDYPPFWMLTLDNQKNVSSLIPNGNQYMRRQDTPNVFKPSGAVYAFRPDLLGRLSTLFPIGNTKGFYVDPIKSVNIDSYRDLYLAREIARAEGL